MSIGLLLTDLNDKTSFLPIATEAVFNQGWLPIINQANLEWMRLFQTGLAVEQADLASILAEITIFKRLLNSENHYYSLINQRISLLESQFLLCLYVEFKQLYIG
ncbi:hypothetical protein [Herpetosiphon giganteus]|uniref:hypothetical protein n=1 Tax=Herpetosiphon giganteus TaxID=2029754 RepID=UPI001957F6ED|nr:hypothetical protein [Herpetosiphon giganteus]MBM7844982.1 hypothetical protein [Herpetosiphon giganteus]